MNTLPRFASILRPELAEMVAYVPHPGAYEVRLDANEAPPLLSPEAHARLARALVPPALQRYPDPRSQELREAIAAHAGATPDEVLAGAGSDEVIALLLGALDRPREGLSSATIVTTTPTFVMYRHSARARGIKTIEVPLDARWDLDVGGMKRAIEFGRPNIIFVATPNNPTGGAMSEERLRAVIEAAPDALVVIDEAYVAFAQKSAASLRGAYPNVAVLGTLSKIGFASLRVGWVVAPAELIAEVDKVRQPYNLSIPQQRGATFVLREMRAEIEAVKTFVVAERERIAGELRRMGIEVTPSEANFLWIETPHPAVEVFESLAKKGVLVRSFGARGGRLSRRLRVTVGLTHENDRLLEALAEWT
ncbi:histidinol-phosphate transaminase [Polyangium aurulentum]|uniref:histidinol-phosphate transaminase n=1 Tax=Polyangium aurulentum TaxID=2567896 RepID=UPI0010AED6E0|nr:histidinol-phosphate transaminase [Polyangium aurulentum]UQA56032.1 histidinol-phosphate transaminase [Polyangium aurulentum]